MSNALSRVRALEVKGAAAVSVCSPTSVLRRYLARTPAAALRSHLPDFSDEQFADLLADVREEIPGYGVELCA